MMLKRVLTSMTITGIMIGAVMQPAVSMMMRKGETGENKAYSLIGDKPSNASANYIVTFENQSNSTLYFVKGLHDCMKNSGPESFKMDPRNKQIFGIEDSNFVFEDCTNATKDISWKVYLKEGGEEVNLITFSHEKHGGTWYTIVTDIDRTISATCNGTPCSNTGNFGVTSGGPIKIYVYNQ